MAPQISLSDSKYLSRQNLARDSFPKSAIDAFCTFKPENIRYLTNVSSDNAILLIDNKKSILFTDPRYGEEAKRDASGVDVRVVTNILEEFTKEIGKGTSSTLGFESEDISYARYKRIVEKSGSLKLIPTYNLVEDARTVKDADEIERTRGAITIAAKGFQEISKNLLPGITEQDISAELEYQVRKQGAEKIAFDFIVVSGKRGSLPHGIGTEKVIEGGDLLTIDFGAKHRGYHSDCTRTLAIGKIEKKEKRIYQIVLTAQREAINKVRDGIPAKEIDKIARDIIEDAGYGEYFGHGTGHGVGLEVHESPRVSANSNTILKAGMIITIEPAIYIPNFGGVRIEDMILVTKNGYEVLTSAIPKINMDE